MVTGGLVLEDTGGSVEDEKTGILGQSKMDENFWI